MYTELENYTTTHKPIKTFDLSRLSIDDSEVKEFTWPQLIPRKSVFTKTVKVFGLKIFVVVKRK